LTLKISWKIIENIDELITYKSQWQDLAEKSPDGFFTSPQWLLEWINVYWQKDWTLRVIIGSIDNDLSVLAPFYIQNKKIFGITYNLLFPLGQGEVEYAEVASEYQDILVAIKHDDIYAEIAHQIKSLTYDNLYWRAITKQANLLKISQYLTQTNVAIAGARYAINTKDSQAVLVSKNNRYKWNKCKKLLQDNNAHFFWCDKDQLQDHWLQLKEIHTRRWRLKNKSGAFTSKAFNIFHQNIIQRDLCKISVLTIKGKLAAINYYLIGDNCLYFYQSGWENNYALLSPGFSLHKWSIENNALACYDFMMGEKKQSYKNSYSCNQIADMFTLKQKSSPVKHWFYKFKRKLRSNFS
tara:strand:- start:398 stop:1456 length:1059 start_codon:yes stop_codon:yes gene_type:complete